MRLSQLFDRCVHRSYIHVENAADYAIDRVGDALYVYLECSNGIEDWKNNLDFPARAYNGVGSVAWLAHRGFVRVWKSVEAHVSRYLLDASVKHVVIVGYSHGAALAVLCHEYVWYNRPDLRDSIEGYGFGCPRVLWGWRRRCVCRRWERFTVIRNLDDLVTHLPPALLGFFHVGRLCEIGERGHSSPVDAHRPESIYAMLLRAEAACAENGTNGRSHDETGNISCACAPFLRSSS